MIETIESARAFPDAIDGTPQNYNDREALHNKNDDTPRLVPGDKINQEIIEACQEVIDIKHERKELNARINAITERMESQGIPRKSFKLNLTLMEMNEDERLAIDRGLIVTRRATGIPQQADLFEN